jgi:hypothetical protein
VALYLAAGRLGNRAVADCHKLVHLGLAVLGHSAADRVQDQGRVRLGAAIQLEDHDQPLLALGVHGESRAAARPRIR